MDKVKYVHRVGTVTFGCCLILFGVLFLSRLFIPAFPIDFVFRLWPCMFIILGIEVLLANAGKNAEFVYDKTAIVLMIVLFLFAMCLAGCEKLMEQGYLYLY
ncbi:MAG: hypothetical protein IJZ82_03640 [Lachnospiraceae bacterium]|nr:hypothetical protein [Lachnospiraceae bacterium]